MRSRLFTRAASVTAGSVMLLGISAGVAFAASTVNVSDNDGSGSAHATHWSSSTASESGNLKSTHGASVYYQGRLVVDLNSDATCGRISQNVTSTSSKSVSGNCSIYPPEPGTVSGVKFKVCRVINNLPDSCGPWSSKSS